MTFPQGKNNRVASVIFRTIRHLVLTCGDRLRNANDCATRVCRLKIPQNPSCHLRISLPALLQRKVSFPLHIPRSTTKMARYPNSLVALRAELESLESQVTVRASGDEFSIEKRPVAHMRRSTFSRSKRGAETAELSNDPLPILDIYPSSTAEHN